MSKCTTNAMIEDLQMLKGEDLGKGVSVRFSQTLSRELAEGILKNAGKLDLKTDDLAVILDHLIHAFAEGKVSIS